jgi:hypothetical protein
VGFLDRQSRVLDVVLTGRGRELLAAGELDFAYYSFFDDGLDYDPWSTGSLTDEERDELIQSSPMLEAPVVQDRRTSVIPLEPTSFVFKAAPDYLVLPRMLDPNPTGSLASLRCDQVSSGSWFTRTGTSLASVPLRLTGEHDGTGGFSVHVYSSGSNGLTEVRPKLDLKGRRAFDPFVAVSVDEEVPQQDLPKISRPDSVRRGGRG